MLYDVAPTDARRASLEDYIDAIRRRKLLVLLCIALALLLAYVFLALRTPDYTATARVVVSPTPVGSVNQSLDRPNLDREVEVIVSDPIAQDAVAILGDASLDPLGLRREVEAEFEPDSDVIRVSYTSTDPERAADIASAFATAYVNDRVANQSQFYSEQAGVLSDQLATITLRITDLDAELADLEARRQAVALLPADDVTRQPELQRIDQARSVVVAERNSQLGEERTAQRELNNIEAELASQLPAAKILREAGVPQVDNGLPQNWVYLAAVIVGLGGGLVAAFLSIRLDRTAGAARDVELALETSVLGRIPDLGLRSRFEGRNLVMLSRSRSSRHQMSREAYRRLRSTIQFILANEEATAITFTSSMAGEGKSVTAGNLAVALVDAGTQVALINADMRRPTTEILFGIDNTQGLSEFLGAATDDLHYVFVDGYDDRLLIVPSGPIPANPGELISSDRFSSMIKDIKDAGYTVIVDTPPVNATADALATSRAVDGAIIVVDGRVTSIPELLSVKRDLDNSGLEVLGAVLNRDRSETGRRWRRRRNRYAYAEAASGAARAAAEAKPARISSGARPDRPS